MIFPYSIGVNYIYFNSSYFCPKLGYLYLIYKIYVNNNQMNVSNKNETLLGCISSYRFHGNL